MSQAGQFPEASILNKFLLKGKNIVITGGSRGLGFNFAYTLAQVGANIAVIDLSEHPSEDMAKLEPFGGKYRYYQADVVDYQLLKNTVDRIHADFGSIDGWQGPPLSLLCSALLLCIPAAGIIRDKPFLEHTEKDFRDTMDVNVNGVFFTVQHCTAKMAQQGTGGTVVCIASTAGHKSLAPQEIAAYTASKYAVRGIAKHVAHELAKYGIRVNSISPGTVQTDMLESVMRQNPSRRKLFLESNALGRLAAPDELSGMVLYLMSEASSYTTGQDFLVDGGMV
ncbi:uncharacterized protein A1O5_06260 [Cladophialophora psammophila CBS 110553]|uniref:Uncharacterized protein n=1 Tax=Cladophialophora psammophila CBS 110553 TaxID=1182543 RepID=W9WPS1_9EURO|nr:uncharacterized protein A1O5_06260 [Cladophialophora psammophila CBS 110553]EXJ70192.1 hypothetical protein A1O5_06260 [Cladophialophora psammophila CBS 110553]